MTYEPSWTYVTLKADEVLIVRFTDPPTQQSLTDFAAGIPQRLRGRVVVFAQPVELETVTVHQRPLLIAQLQELVRRLEALDPAGE